ncbi:hypothetical protein [Agarivorans sp. 1_MG-2023]|uniref:hypothetical protein n=1 Tax=Agarivorans sp. 1_MG-2023 TaxID=3062634 RepID=UPI0026E11423|nr:hypothetical protein [Agarivorans sp. 1_MG-2023]MDO6763311.1 hypothetical protein [Agarivorans sp. 1_MG-2023]
MELLRPSNLLIPVCLSLTLVACGGGGSASSNNSQTSEPAPELPTVNGVMKSKAASGFVYPTNTLSMYDSKICRNYDRYYETDKVMVFGGSNTSTELFERFASWTEFGLTDLQQRMGTDLLALQQRYPFSLETYLVATTFFQEHASTFEGKQLYLQITGEELTTDYDDLIDETLQKKYLYQKIRHLDKSQMANLITMIKEQLDPSSLSDSFGQSLPEKPIVCLNNGFNNTNYWATGNLVGYTARTDDDRPTSAYIVTHELMHTVQHQYVTYLSQVDRWFLEGSAEHAMGHIPDPTTHNNRYPLDDKWESTLGSIAYSHYGIAVGYLEATSPGFIINVLKYIADNGVYHVVTHKQNSEYNYDVLNQPNPDFREAFNAYAKRPDGSALTYSDFESEYHELIDQWIALQPQVESRSINTTSNRFSYDSFDLKR